MHRRHGKGGVTKVESGEEQQEGESGKQTPTQAAVSFALSVRLGGRRRDGTRAQIQRSYDLSWEAPRARRRRKEEGRKRRKSIRSAGASSPSRQFTATAPLTACMCPAQAFNATALDFQNLNLSCVSTCTTTRLSNPRDGRGPEAGHSIYPFPPSPSPSNHQHAPRACVRAARLPLARACGAGGRGHAPRGPLQLYVGGAPAVLQWLWLALRRQRRHWRCAVCAALRRQQGRHQALRRHGQERLLDLRGQGAARSAGSTAGGAWGGREGGRGREKNAPLWVAA